MKCKNCGENISLWQTGYDINGITVCYDCYSNNYEELKHRAKQKDETKKKRVTSINSENNEIDNNKDQWYYSISENEYDGPVSAEKLVKKLKIKSISRKTLVWQTKMDDWQQINQVPEFKEYFNEKTPPPLPKSKKKNNTEVTSPDKPKSNRKVKKSKEPKTKDQKSTDGKPEQTNRWLKFYVNFRIPFGMFVLFLGAISPPSYLLSDQVPVYQLILSALIIIYLVLWAGLYKRKLWAWKFNWVFIFLEPILGGFGQAAEPGEAVIFIGLGMLIYSLPNYIYFKKRKHLFN